jgi:hypothetical protein
MEKGMKLSEAIRLGSLLRRQTFGPFFSSTNCGTCAMGAALEAVGQLKQLNAPKTDATKINSRRVRKIWPWLKWRLDLHHCPWCSRLESFPNVYYLIVHLNDDDHLSREKIAELMTKIEIQVSNQLEPNPSDEARAKLLDLEAHLPQGRKKTHGHKAEETRSLSTVG